MSFEGFAEFVRASEGALFGMALALTSNEQMAHDLVQEALTRTAVHWTKLMRDGNPHAYVRTVLLNEVRSEWRRRRRRNEVVVDVPPEVGHQGDHQGDVVNRIAFVDVLSRLSSRQRLALYLRFYEDRTVTETAELMRCSTGTVKRLCFDGLARIRVIAPELVAWEAYWESE